MKHAVIDVGSNTVRLCIYEMQGGDPVLILNERVMARLGSKTENGALTEEGITAACDALLFLRTFIDEHKAEKISTFATAALRNITNSKEAVAEITKRTGFAIDVLSGEEEARLTYLGAAEEQNITDGVIADIGGGSTELIVVKEGKMLSAISLPIGSLTAYVRFVKDKPHIETAVAHQRNFIKQMLRDKLPEDLAGEVLYGIGGAARAASELEKLLYPESGGAIATLEILLTRLLADKKLAKESILQASPERLDTALPGVAILCEVAHFFGCRRLAVCHAGVREGYLMQKLEG